MSSALVSYSHAFSVKHPRLGMPLVGARWDVATVLAVYSLLYATIASPPSSVFLSLRSNTSTAATLFNETALWRVTTWYMRRARYLAVAACNSSDSGLELFSGILRQLAVPVLLSTECEPLALNTTNSNYSEMSISYIILVENLTKILDIIPNLKILQPFWNPRANFLIVILISSCERISLSTYRDFLGELWTKHGILNVLALTIYSCNERKEEFVYYDPFIRVNASSNGEVTLLKDELSLRVSARLMDKLRDMNKFPIRISMFERKNSALVVKPTVSNQSSTEYYGSDGYTLKELARFMNFTPLTKVPADGHDYGDINKKTGRFTGSIGDIVYDKADIAFNTRFIKDYGSDDVIFANQLSSDYVCIIVPKAKRIPKWLTMLTSFNKNVYFLLLIMYLAFPNIWLAFYKIRCHFLSERDVRLDVGSLYLETLLPFVNMSMVRLPTRRPEMVLAMSCILFGFLIDSMFQAKLLTTITTPVYFRDIDTLEQLDKSKLIITTGSSNLRDTFVKDSGNPVLDHLRAKTKINSSGSIYERVSKYDKFAAISRDSDFRFRSQQYQTDDGMPLIHSVKEFPVFYYLSFMLPKQSPYLSRCNVFIRRIFESGLITQWDKQTTFNIIHSPKVGNSTAEAKKDPGIRVFSVADLQLPFFILVLGHMIAACACFVEVVVNCRRSRSHVHHSRESKVPFLP